MIGFFDDPDVDATDGFDEDVLETGIDVGPGSSGGGPGLSGGGDDPD